MPTPAPAFALLAAMPLPSTQQRQRRRAKEKPRDGCGQQQLKLNGHQYVHKCLTMELHMAAQQQLLQAAQQQAAAARTREQVGIHARHSNTITTRAVYSALLVSAVLLQPPSYAKNESL
jgi:hypothetical protein